MVTKLYGRRISRAISTKMNKVLRTIDPNIGDFIRYSQDHSKKLAIGVYDYSVNHSTFDFTNADVDTTGDTITKPAHGLRTGDAVVLSSAGTLPTGLSTATAYYVIYVSASVIKLASTRANAFAGTAIDITAKTGAGTIVHTLVKGVYGQINLLGNELRIPNGALITRTYYKVYTTFTSTTTDNATIALSLNAANDITTATAIKTAGDIWDAGNVVAGAQTGTEANDLLLTADRELLMTIGTDTLTAGKLKLFVEYIDVEA